MQGSSITSGSNNEETATSKNESDMVKKRGKSANVASECLRFCTPRIYKKKGNS